MSNAELERQKKHEALLKQQQERQKLLQKQQAELKQKKEQQKRERENLDQQRKQREAEAAKKQEKDLKDASANAAAVPGSVGQARRAPQMRGACPQKTHAAVPPSPISSSEQQMAAAQQQQQPAYKSGAGIPSERRSMRYTPSRSDAAREPPTNPAPVAPSLAPYAVVVCSVLILLRWMSTPFCVLQPAGQQQLRSRELKKKSWRFHKNISRGFSATKSLQLRQTSTSKDVCLL